MRRTSRPAVPLAVGLFLTLSLPVMAGPSIVGARLHHHGAENRTRLVIDCTSEPGYDLTVRSSGAVVIIRNARLAMESRLSWNEGFVRGMRFESVTGGIAALVSFDQAATVTHFYVKPDPGNPRHRIVLDFVRGAVRTDVRGNPKFCVILDPGHGGWNHGASGTVRGRKVLEKDVVLDISRRVRRLFQENDQGRTTDVFLTRESDVLPFVDGGRPSDKSSHAKRVASLNGRVDFAEAHASNYPRNYSVFVSIHANWASSSQANGYEIYVANRTAVEKGEEREIERLENEGVASSRVNPSVARLIREGAQTQSRLLARRMLDEFGTIPQMNYHGGDRGLHEANFAVLRTLAMPAVLLETGFLSHSGDAARMDSASYREMMARAIYNSVVQHFRSVDARYPLRPQSLSQTYTVRSGDTLSGIAASHQVSLSALMRANRLNNHIIHPGMMLSIPR